MKSLVLSAMVVLIALGSSAADELEEKDGHSFLLNVEGRVDDGGNKVPATDQEVEGAIRAIEGRLVGMGIAMMLVTREGGDGIRLKVPGVDAEEAKRIGAMLEKTSRLGLHEVCPRNEETDANGETLARRVADGKELVPGYRAHILRGKDGDGNDSKRPSCSTAVRRWAAGTSPVPRPLPSGRTPWKSRSMAKAPTK